MLICFIICFIKRDDLVMSYNYKLTNTSFAGFGQNGEILLIDQEKTAIEILDGDHRLTGRIRGGNQKGFYYAQEAVRGSDGAMYIADHTYLESKSPENSGNSVEILERVLKYQNGKTTVLWEGSPAGSGSSSAANVSIYDLQLYEGNIVFLKGEDHGLDLYASDETGRISLKRRIYSGDVINDASIDMTDGDIAIATRRGFVRIQKEHDNLWKTVSSDDDHLMPQNITIRNGVVYFSDTYANRVCSLYTDAMDAGFKTVYSGDRRIINISSDNEGGRILATDGTGFCVIDSERDVFTGAVRYSGFPLTVILRIILVLGIIIALLYLLRLLNIALGLLRNESVLRVTLVVVATVLVSSFVAYSLMADLFREEDQSLTDNMKLFAESMLLGIDSSDLASLQWEQDYGKSSYYRVRSYMDKMLALAHSESNYYSYVLYRMDENDKDSIRLILDSQDSVMCGQPYQMSAGTYIADIFSTGKSYALQVMDADGSRISVLIPVKDDTGNIYSVLEIDQELGLRNMHRQGAVVNILLNVICTTAVVMMLILEMIFLISFREKKYTLKGKQTREGPYLVPVRTLMFIIYTADCMQEAFIAVLCSRLYTGGLPFSDSVAAALPMSAEVLATAISSAFIGRIAQKRGSKNTLLGGMVLQCAGCLTCLILGNFAGLFLGKTLMGIGMGTVYVTCNIISASGSDEESTSYGFAGVSAGTLSGITIGAGLSSVLLSIGGWRSVYFAGAVFTLLGLWISLSSPDVTIVSQELTSDSQDINFRRFFFNKRVAGFFLLILVPFMIALSYRDYFFPIFAEQEGFGEVRVAQVYLLCGLLVLYIGPLISSWTLKNIGPFYSVILASVLMAAGMLIYVVFPSTLSVLLGVIILSVVISFAYTCQFTFYNLLPEPLSYGEGRAMSIYSVFENIGQTLGPVFYGFILTFGQIKGVGISGILLLAMALLFAALLHKSATLYK